MLAILIAFNLHKVCREYRMKPEENHELWAIFKFFLFPPSLIKSLSIHWPKTAPVTVETCLKTLYKCCFPAALGASRHVDLTSLRRRGRKELLELGLPMSDELKLRGVPRGPQILKYSHQPIWRRSWSLRRLTWTLSEALDPYPYDLAFHTAAGWSAD